MSQSRKKSNDDSLRDDIRALRKGEAEAADRLIAGLTEPVRRNVESFLGRDGADRDDVVQDALIETLKYLDRDEAFEGDLIRLAITIARNRCRDLLRWRGRHPQAQYEALAGWLTDPATTVLEEIEERERLGLLQAALNGLSDQCRELLRALYIDAIPTQEMRRHLGLGTVHAVYYRREVCLKHAKNHLQKLLAGRSATRRPLPSIQMGDRDHG